MTILDRYYGSAMLYVREYYLMAIIQAIIAIQGVIQQWKLDETRIHDYQTLSPSLQGVWKDVKELNWDSYLSLLVGNADTLSQLLYEKGIASTIEVVIETYLRKCGK